MARGSAERPSRPAALTLPYPWTRMRSDRSCSWTESVVGVGRTAASFGGAPVRVAPSVSPVLVRSMTPAPPCVRELLAAFSRAQPVPSTARTMTAPIPAARRVMVIALSSLRDAGCVASNIWDPANDGHRPP